MNKNFKKIIVATGGTGGHIFPALGLAKHFVQNNLEVEIVSDKRGSKYLKKNDGININIIDSSSIYGKNIFKALFSIIKIFFSLFRSFKFLLLKKPDIVFGMGGYSSFPICIASKILNIPFIIYENNLYLGRANRFLLPYTKQILVSYKELEGIPKKYENKVEIVGNIIRQEIINFSKDQNLDFHDKKIKILVLGGSQAAKIFAEKLPKIFEKCTKNGISLTIYQQCLPIQNEYLNNFYLNLNIEFETFNFSDNLLNYFSRTDLAITRSGSSMLAELLNSNIPFISIPLPTSADNHQLKNAIYYEKNHYSYMVEEKNLEEKLFTLLENIFNNKNLLKQIADKQMKYSDKSVYEKIDKILKKLKDEKH